MPRFAALACISCDFSVSKASFPSPMPGECPRCGAPLLMAVPNGSAAPARPSSDDLTEGVSRYAALLPVDPGSPLPPHQRTPLLGLAGVPGILLKLESSLPSAGSDFRGMAVGACFAREEGFRVLLTSGSGEASAAAALCSASADLLSVAFLPAGTTVADHLCAEMCGQAEPVDGAPAASTRELRSWEAALPDEQRRRCLDLSAPHHPVRIEGAKTLAFEVAEQMSWSLPERVVCPARPDLILGLRKGFGEMARSGWTEAAIPAIFAVELEMDADAPEPPKPVTAAIHEAARASGGAALRVTLEQALAAMHAAAHGGRLLSLEGAAALAAAQRLQEESPAAGQRPVVVIDPSSAERSSEAVARARRLRRPFNLPRSLPVGGIITPV